MTKQDCPYCHAQNFYELGLVAKTLWNWSKKQGYDYINPKFIGANMGYSAICKQKNGTYKLMIIDGDEYPLSSFPIEYCPVCGRYLND